MADAYLTALGSPLTLAGSVAFGSFSLNGNTDQLEFIFQAPEDVVITQLWVRLNAVTGTSPVYIVSLQGVDASGNPDGVIKGGGSPASATFTPSGSGTWQKVSLANSYSASRGEFLAVVMAYSSGTIDGSNFASMSVRMTGFYPGCRFPYAINNDAGSRTRQTDLPCFGFASASKAYGFPVLAASTTTINNSEMAGKFTLPATWGSTYQVAGVRIVGGSWTAAKTLTVRLYQGGLTTDTGTVLQDVTLDSDAISRATSGDVGTFLFDGTLSTLNFGGSYRLSFDTDDASNQSFLGFTVTTANDLAAFGALGPQLTLSTRTTGDWTDTGTTRLLWELILADITAPSASGGVIVPSNVFGAENLWVG